MKLSGYGYILIAAALWATLGLFYKGLITAFQFSPLAIVFYRALIAALILFFILGIWRRSDLHLGKGDRLFFIVFGLFGVAAFFYIYIYAIALVGMGVAAVLLYTAPIWVTIFSVVIYHEHFDLRKGSALLLATVGAALVGKVYYLISAQINLLGFLAGLGAGIGYATYILFNKAALQRNYQPWTVNAYALGIGALWMLPILPSQELLHIFIMREALPWLILLGILPTLGGSLAFNAGLQRIPATNASIVATFEPLIAVILGRIFFSEKLEVPQLIGGILIVFAVIILQTSSNSRNNPENSFLT